MGRQWVPKENALAQFLWAFHFDFTSASQVIFQAGFSIKRPSPGESQIIETDECCPSAGFESDKNCNLDFFIDILAGFFSQPTTASQGLKA